jgi:hypothetical protein
MPQGISIPVPRPSRRPLPRALRSPGAPFPCPWERGRRSQVGTMPRGAGPIPPGRGLPGQRAPEARMDQRSGVAPPARSTDRSRCSRHPLVVPEGVADLEEDSGFVLGREVAYGSTLVGGKERLEANVSEHGGGHRTDDPVGAVGLGPASPVGRHLDSRPRSYSRGPPLRDPDQRDQSAVGPEPGRKSSGRSGKDHRSMT